MRRGRNIEQGARNVERGGNDIVKFNEKT